VGVGDRINRLGRLPDDGGRRGPEHNDNGDAFATRFQRIHLRLAYSTFLGGLGADVGNAITVDEKGKAVLVTGSTESGEYLTTVGAYQEMKDGAADAFVTKLRAIDGEDEDVVEGG
jgi:hypothetical protein